MLHHLLPLAKLGESSHSRHPSSSSEPLCSRSPPSPVPMVRSIASFSSSTDPPQFLPSIDPGDPNLADPLFAPSSSTVRLVKHTVPLGLDPLLHQTDLVPRSGTRSSPGYPYTPTTSGRSRTFKYPLASKQPRYHFSRLN